MKKINFWNRKKELQFMDAGYAREGLEMLLLYGRRRVGKSELIKQFSQDKPHIYYLCDKRGTVSNVKEMARICANFFGDIPPDVSAFYELFGYISARWREKGKGKLIVAIDEFPYLVEKDDSIPSVFQKVVDETLAGADVLLVLCGSSISMMEEVALSYRAPLYGRRAGEFEVMPMRFADVYGYLKPMPMHKAVELYAFFGNVPAYFTAVDRERSVERELLDKVMSKGSRLYMEPEYLLREELRDISTYRGILQAMARSTRLSEIASKAGIPAKDMPKYLKTLMSLRLVSKEMPATLKKSKKVRYMIEDNLFRFWFRSCDGNLSYLEEGREGFVYDEFVRPDFNSIVSYSFEKLCREAVRAACPFAARAVGSWWGKNPAKQGGDDEEEIDIVAIGEKTDDILFGECKWSTQAVGTPVYADLKRKAAIVEWHAGRRTEHYALFSRSGFTSGMRDLARAEGVMLFDLDAIEKALLP